MSVPPIAQRVLAFLAVHDRPLARSYVAGNLWRDAEESAASACLRSALWRLRPAAPFVEDGPGGALTLSDDVDVDVRRVQGIARKLIAKDNSAMAVASDDERAVRIDELSEELLPDWYDEWVVLERERVRQLCLHALEARAERLIMRGWYAEAIETAQAAITMELLRESSHRSLIRAHVAEGNYAAAVAQYERFRHLLNQEMGIEPSPMLRRLLAPLTGR